MILSKSKSNTIFYNALSFPSLAKLTDFFNALHGNERKRIIIKLFEAYESIIDKYRC